MGRAYQFIFFDGPYRVILWDQALLEKPIGFLFGITWEQYATSFRIGEIIEYCQVGTGVIFFIAGVAAMANRGRLFSRLIIGISVFLLFILYFLELKDNFFRLGNFIEHSTQLLTPVFLLMLTSGRSRYFLLAGKVAVALTFIGHGLYAVGYYPRPGRFVDLVIGSLGCSEETAIYIITVAGVIDFIISLGIFFPGVSILFLKYMVFWGGLTAVSRLTADFNFDFLGSSLHQSLYLVAYRLCHALLPLALLFYEQLEAKSHEIFSGSVKADSDHPRERLPQKAGWIE